MADIRIKDLTLTSSSASDDFIAIDGTTNGTRKLSAFSPTFGGNATVTGTLTVNGGSADLGTGHGVKLYVNNAGAWANKELLVTGYDVLDYTQIKVPGNASNTASIKLNQNGLATFSGNILVSGTTASTTTSSGALVVSGGVGVAGAINAGGNIVLSPASVAASGEVGNLRIADSSNTNRKLFFGIDNTVSPNGVGYIQSTLTGTTTIPLQLQPLGGSLSVGNSGTVLTVNGTTASTSTSSGALVVSGGVGVAGAIYAGGDIAIPADKGIYIKQGNVQKWTSDGTPTGTSRADIYADSGGAFFVRTGGATQALTISSSQNATFAGSIAINNTVTTGVSVVSTHKVQISIGGTTYYLLASNV